MIWYHHSLSDRHGRRFETVEDAAAFFKKENEELHVENERFRDALWQISQWSRAYPLKVFPEPDFAIAAAVLAADGRVSLDAISASNMRHVVEGVGKIASDALGKEK